MSPERAARGYSSGSSSSSSKPYARNGLSSPGASTYGVLLPVTDSASGSLSLGGSNGGGSSLPSAPPSPTASIVERPGFPTYAQYKQIETGYIESLTPRRQGKALISQSMFDRIWDVLHHPESQLETAQFRFWARKMFTINKNYRITLGVAEGQVSPPQEVLLHDNLLVAIQEQLYDLLCYCHGSTGHGGRDKTCALIRKHYTWVPKDLVSNFIKSCPTCIMKKCGNMDVTNSQIPQLMAEADKMSAAQSGTAARTNSAARLVSAPVTSTSHHRAVLPQEATPATRPSRRRIPTVEAHTSASPMLSFQESGDVYMKMSATAFGSALSNLPNLQDTSNQLVSNPWSLMGSTHSTPHHSGLTLAPLMELEHDASTRDNAPVAGISGNLGMPQPQSLHSSPHLGGNQYQYHQPMVREVSLYKGLPNGWQYRHDDFEAAHAEFMDTKRHWDASPTVADVEVPSFRGGASLYGVHAGARVPDIAGLWSPDQFRGMVKEEEEEELSNHQHGIIDNLELEYPMPPAMMRHMDLSGSCLPSALRDFHQSLGSPSLDVVPSQAEYMSPIDPALLGMPAGDMGVGLEQGQALLNNSDFYGAAAPAEEEPAEAGMTASSTSTSLNMRRAQALPRLDLSFLQGAPGTPDLQESTTTTATAATTTTETATETETDTAIVNATTTSATVAVSEIRTSPMNSVNSNSSSGSESETPLDTPVDLIPGKDGAESGDIFTASDSAATVKLEALIVEVIGVVVEEGEGQGLQTDVGPAISAF